MRFLFSLSVSILSILLASPAYSKGYSLYNKYTTNTIEGVPLTFYIMGANSVDGTVSYCSIAHTTSNTQPCIPTNTVGRVTIPEIIPSSQNCIVENYDALGYNKWGPFKNGLMVQQIWDYAFANCTKMTSVVIPASVTK